MTSQMPEIYDTEIIEVERLLNRMREKAERQVNYQGFQDEIIDRMAEIGFTCKVEWYETNVDGLKMPEVTITGRCEGRTFDHDKQVHQAVNNVLQLPGQEGWIKTQDSEALSRMKKQQEDHKH